MPDIIFTLKTAVKFQHLDLPPDKEILSFRTIHWMGNEGNLFYNVTNEKETTKTFVHSLIYLKQSLYVKF